MNASVVPEARPVGTVPEARQESVAPEARPDSACRKRAQRAEERGDELSP
jgi:hypothetical protein